MPVELILLNSLIEGEIKKPHLLMRLVPRTGIEQFDKSLSGLHFNEFSTFKVTIQ
jgi:hypothetical protein